MEDTMCALAPRVLNESQWGKKQQQTTDDEKHLENKHFSYFIGERVYIQSGSQGDKGQLYKSLGNSG